MKIKPESYNYHQPEFKGIYNNKAFLKGLETISDHGTSFVAGVSLASSLFLRPTAIQMAPSVEKENKKYAGVNSIASGIARFLTVEAIALPIENAIKNIDKNPDKFLKKETVNNLKNGAKSLVESKDYKFATQVLKLGVNFVTAIPKSMLTIALIPIIMDKFINKKNKNLPNASLKKENYDPVFSPFFKGNMQNKISSGIGKILDIKEVQGLIGKYSKNDQNIARNISMATDVLLTSAFAIQTKKNKKIEEKRKNPLILNNLISTGITLLGGYTIDNLIQKGGKNFLEKFKNANKNNPKLPKYIEGLNILRPTLIFAGLYYGILPVASTFLAEKTDKLSKKSSLKGNIS